MLILIYLLFCSIAVNSQRANVCNKIIDYSTRINCEYNPDLDADTDVITKNHGYPSETHDITTEDGYILKVFRLPNNSADAQTIFIQHGANTDSTVWVDIGNRSLAFYLFDMGYDVWMGNIRGSWYSRGHVNQSANFNFWDFNLDDLARYDISGQLNYVKSNMKEKINKKIIYIGHSMGTTMSYIYSIIRKEEAENNVCGFIHFAPVTYFDHATVGMLMLAPLTNSLQRLFALRGIPITADRSLNQLFYRYFCFQHAVTAEICNIFIFWFTGWNPPQRQPRDLPLLYSYFTSGISSRVVSHFLQFRHQIFNRFDYGLDNLRRYGSIIPPSYDIKKINNRFLLLYGPRDTFSHIGDINNFRNKLSDPGMFEVMDVDNFNHLDFMYAKDIIPLLYEKMFPFMQRVQKEHCQ